MSEDALRREAYQKATDNRYPPAMRSWLKDTLVTVYGKHIGNDRAREIVDEVWQQAEGA